MFTSGFLTICNVCASIQQMQLSDSHLDNTGVSEMVILGTASDQTTPLLRKTPNSHVYTQKRKHMYNTVARSLTWAHRKTRITPSLGVSKTLCNIWSLAQYHLFWLWRCSCLLAGTLSSESTYCPATAETSGKTNITIIVYLLTHIHVLNHALFTVIAQ